MERSARMDLNELVVFARVVHAGSFTKAAEQLALPKSTVSRKISDLEARLNTRLLQRTTRKLSLTDAGRVYYEYCQRIVAEVEDADRAVSTLQAAPSGLLRVTAPVNASFLGPIVRDYLAKYPNVRLELFCTSRTVDLVEEGFDVGIRAGPLAPSSLIARRLGSASWHFVAAPAYLERRGRLRAPTSLSEHDCLLFGTAVSGVTLRLTRADRVVAVTVDARLAVTDMDVLYDAVVGGLGIAMLPAYQCASDLQTGTLERVLSDWSPPSTPVHAVYASARHVSSKVKSFVDHLRDAMTPPPWEHERSRTPRAPARVDRRSW